MRAVKIIIHLQLEEMRTVETYLISALTLCATSLHAAEPEKADSVRQQLDLNEIEVVGIKVNRHNITPASVSVMGEQQMKNSLVNDIEDLSAQLPNIFIPEYGSRQTTPIVIRGIYSKVKGTAVGYYIDCLPHFELSAFDTDMLDVKAIEVFRGPQGTLHGRNTIGGVINVYNYTPFEYQGTKIRLRYGNYNTIKAQASHYAMLTDQLGINASGYYEHRDGFFTNRTLGEKADRLNTAGGKLALHLRPSSQWTMRLSSNLDYLDQGGYPYSAYNPETDELADITYNRPCGYRRLISNTGFNVKYSSGKWSLNSQTSFEYIRDDQEVDQDFTAKDTYFVTNGIRHSIFSEELTVKSEHEGRFQWVAGAFLFSQTGTQDQGTDYLTKDYEQRSLYDNPIRGAALFAQGSLNMWRGLSATAGVRLDYEHNSMDYCRTQYNHADGSQKTVGTPFSETLTATEFIPRIGLQYVFNDENTLFANVSKGYKGGGFNATIPTEADRTYDAEHNWNYELGLKFGNRNRRFLGELTLFYIDWRNQHISQVLPGVGTVVSNAGHSDSKGVEFSMTHRPLDDLVISGSYGYTYARFLDYVKDEAKGLSYSGNMVPMVPRHTLAFNMSYTVHPVKCLDAITMSAGMTGTGKLYWLEDNAVCQNFYLIPNARVELSKGIVSLAMWGKNLSNTRYLSYYFVSSAKYAQQGGPLTCGADLTLKF